MLRAAVPLIAAHAVLVGIARAEASAVGAGRCDFAHGPVQEFFWDPSCQAGMEGCLADGKQVECRFCGGFFSAPCPAAGGSVSSPADAGATSTAPPSTGTTLRLPTSNTTTTTTPATTTTPKPTTKFLSPTKTIPTSAVVMMTPAPSSSKWTTGTWTTGYWDCCKPSCAWPGKGRVNKPANSCDAKTGAVLQDPNVPSVCQGGTAAACADQKPFIFHANLSMGFAAAAVSGHHGLTGDANCGQCFELKFVNQAHSGGNWGGADRELVGKRMIVQVTNIGYDVTGDHSFDLQIPGAGQGAFTSGCMVQFPGHSSGDFDCDNHFGGCSSKAGCARLPEVLRAACEWRYDWIHWLEHAGKTNNPYVDFRRVRCPEQLTTISGSVPADDEDFPIADLGSDAGL